MRLNFMIWKLKSKAMFSNLDQVLADQGISGVRMMWAYIDLTFFYCWIKPSKYVVHKDFML